MTATQSTRDAISAIEDARAPVHDLLGRSLLDDLTRSATGEVTPVIVVPDNGPWYKSAGFARYVARAHARAHPPPVAPDNGVIERYHGAIQIEHLWRQLPADGAEMTSMVEAFRQLYNTIRPHETLAGARPIERYLAEPTHDPITPVQTRQSVPIS